jgi:hypothetical protein
MRHTEALHSEDPVDMSPLAFLVTTRAPTPIRWAIVERTRGAGPSLARFGNALSMGLRLRELPGDDFDDAWETRSAVRASVCHLLGVNYDFTCLLGEVDDSDDDGARKGKGEEDQEQSQSKRRHRRAGDQVAKHALKQSQRDRIRAARAARAAKQKEREDSGSSKQQAAMLFCFLRSLRWTWSAASSVCPTHSAGRPTRAAAPDWLADQVGSTVLRGGCTVRVVIDCLLLRRIVQLSWRGHPVPWLLHRPIPAQDRRLRNSSAADEE